ncbi:unnamed protein product, partial [marine sediment metagenome]
MERLCDRVLLLNSAKAEGLGSAKDTIVRYYQLVNKAYKIKPSETLKQFQDFDRPGTGQIRITNVEILNAQREATNKIEALQPMTIAIEFMAFKPIHGPRFSIRVYSTSNVIITSLNTTGITEKMTFHGKHRLEYTMPKVQLMSDIYSLEVKVGCNLLLDILHNAAQFKVELKNPDAINLSGNLGLLISEG